MAIRFKGDITGLRESFKEIRKIAKNLFLSINHILMVRSVFFIYPICSGGELCIP